MSNAIVNIDTDKGGFISTIALKDSNTYFDITGDGINQKEAA